MVRIQMEGTSAVTGSPDSHVVTVDGYHLPVALAGHPALEFCNTYWGWNTPSVGVRGDYLTCFDAFAVWSGHAGILDASTVTEVRRIANQDTAYAEQALDEARQFRNSLYVTLTNGDERGFAAVAAAAHEASVLRRLRRDGDGPARWELPSTLGERLPLMATAASAADLLTSVSTTAVHACPGQECGWLFLDRTGRRRWCTMAICGNRAKVRAHAARRRTGRAAE